MRPGWITFFAFCRAVADLIIWGTVALVCIKLIPIIWNFKGCIP